MLENHEILDKTLFSMKYLHTKAGNIMQHIIIQYAQMPHTIHSITYQTIKLNSAKTENLDIVVKFADSITR